MSTISEELNHWSKIHAKVAVDTYGGRQVVCTGWSPSGMYHIGNSREAVTCNAIHRQLLELGAESKYLFVVDDFDPLRKIPVDLKQYGTELKAYLGHPLNLIPDFTDSYSSYAEYFASGAIKALNDWNFDVEFINASDLYSQGKYNNYIEIYYNKEQEVQSLLQRISGSPLNSFISIVCENCGNAKTTTITNSFNNTEFEYVCRTDKAFVGCEFNGTITKNSKNWKLKWRLDWPARQTFLGVTVEPSGKDHSVAGGSVDSALEIHKEIFNHEPPMLLRYGFITLKGKKFSGSAGGALAASRIVEIMPYSAYLFMIYRSEMLKDISFDPSSEEYGILLDEFDISRRMFRGEKFEGRDREVPKLSVAADLAMSDDERNSVPLKSKFSELTLIYQTSLNNREKTIEKLEKLGKIYDPSTRDELNRRLPRIDRWLNELAPDNVKFTLHEENPLGLEKFWTQEIKELWLNALNFLTSTSSSEDFMLNIRKFGKDLNLGPKDFFPPFYQMMTGTSRGPNAGNLVLALGKEQLIERINSIDP